MEEKQKNTESNTECCSTGKCNNWPYIVIIILLVIIAILAFFAWANIWGKWGLSFGWIKLPGIENKKDNTTGSDNVGAKDIVVKIVWDKRCKDCYTDEIITSLKSVPFLTGATFEEMDFKDEWASDLLKENGVTKLPAFLLNTNNVSDEQFKSFLTATPAWLYSLNVWAKFDPYAEVCDNKADDNEDGKIDCEDPTCTWDYRCTKVDKPVADLYIMSYCPYWLQAQKWYLEVISKLGKVADVNVKWVQYVMHGQKEADENVVQYCIQKEQKETYAKYLNCFLAADWKWEACRKEAWINEKKLTSCIDATKKEFKVDENMKDTTKQYPDFTIDKEAAVKAWVQWSPSFVLNGKMVENIWRNAKAYAEAICSTFKDRPKECDETFQDVNFDPMFWFTTWNGANAANSGCAQ